MAAFGMAPNGIVLHGPNNELIASEGDFAPGTGTTFFRLDDPAANGANEVVFRGLLPTSETDRSTIYRHTLGMSTLLRRSGDPAPAMLGGNYTDLFHPDINGAGDVTFRAFVGSTDALIRYGSPDTEIAVEGDLAPGTTGTFLAFSSASLNSAGDIAFGATIDVGIR